jgi:hypothetical protein
MRSLAPAILLLPLLLGCPEEVDEFNDLLPLAVGNVWEYDSDADDQLWSIEILDGAGFDGSASFDFTIEVGGVTYEPHDLYAGEDGWTEVDPSDEVPDLFLRLPAEAGYIWEFEFIGNNVSYSTMSYESRQDLNTPAGDFDQTWEVLRDKRSIYGTTEFTQLVRDWYAPGIGLIKRVITNNEGEDTTLVLTSFELVVEE